MNEAVHIFMTRALLWLANHGWHRLHWLWLFGPYRWWIAFQTNRKHRSRGNAYRMRYFA